MSETATAKPESKPVQVKTSNTPRLLRVAAIKPSELPEQKDGQTIFSIHYVKMEGRAVPKALCTEMVFNWVRANKPSFDVRCHFVLTIDPESGLITHITATPKPDLLPTFKKTQEEGKEPPPTNVELTLFPDGSIAATRIPERVNDSILTEIQNAVTDYEGDLHPGMRLGRFTLVERRELQGKTVLQVDPMPR